jgi:membrane protease YdiL (CAAX protease family)
VILALERPELPSLVLASSGVLVLAALAWRPLLRPVAKPFRDANPSTLLVLALLLFLAAQLGGALVVGGGGAGRILGLALPLAASLFVARLVRRDVLLPRGSLPWRVGMGLLHLWAALPLVYGTYLLARWVGLPEQASVTAIRERVDGWAAVAVAAAFVAPLAEEVCFRGLVYPALRARLRAPHAILFSSLSFGLVHAPAVWLPMAIFGAVLAWLTEATGSLAPAVAAHTAFNAFNVALLLAF